MSSRLDAKQDNILRPFMPELDSVRGVAILMVVLFHGFGVPYGPNSAHGLLRLFAVATQQGWAGVNLFFVLSGFLITGILLDTKERPRYYSRFYYRRSLRILPAYYALLLILLVVPLTGWFANRHISWKFVGLSAVYLSNVTTFFGVREQYGVLWSLAVEEHFYLIWPTAIKLLSKRGVLALGAMVLALVPLFRVVALKVGST
ncbi:MAG TPA: acyltransferase, partial [Terriglobales bacterium]